MREEEWKKGYQILYNLFSISKTLFYLIENSSSMASLLLLWTVFQSFAMPRLCNWLSLIQINKLKKKTAVLQRLLSHYLFFVLFIDFNWNDTLLVVWQLDETWGSQSTKQTNKPKIPIPKMFPFSCYRSALLTFYKVWEKYKLTASNYCQNSDSVLQTCVCRFSCFDKGAVKDTVVQSSCFVVTCSHDITQSEFVLSGGRVPRLHWWHFQRHSILHLPTQKSAVCEAQVLPTRLPLPIPAPLF